MSQNPDEEVMVSKRLIRFALYYVGLHSALRLSKQPYSSPSELAEDISEEEEALSRIPELEKTDSLPVGYYQLKEILGDEIPSES